MVCFQRVEQGIRVAIGDGDDHAVYALAAQYFERVLFAFGVVLGGHQHQAITGRARCFVDAL